LLIGWQGGIQRKRWSQKRGTKKDIEAKAKGKYVQKKKKNGQEKKKKNERDETRGQKDPRYGRWERRVRLLYVKILCEDF